MSDSADIIATEVIRALFDRATVSAWIIDAEETILLANDAATALTGYSVDELVGRPVSMLMDSKLAAVHARYVRSYLFQRGQSSILGQVREFEIVRKDGARVPIELKAFELPGAPGGEPLFGAFVSDNTAHKRVEAEMRQAARHDYLTGCLNRLGFMERAHQELSRARRGARSLSLLVMDIDSFKQVNDTEGHQGGDKVLANLLPALSGVLRTHDVFGRVGGEEFFVLLPETDIDGAARIAERLRDALEQHAFICNGKTVSVTASLGCASLGPNDDLDRLITRADRRMYLAKRAGRNRVFAADMVPTAQNSTSSRSEKLTRRSCPGSGA